jgi:hypothetical protein
MARSIRSDRWRDWVMLVLAVWLFLSPWILGFAGAPLVEGEAVAGGPGVAAWNAWIVGIVIGALAIWAVYSFAEWHDWANGVLGVWLVIAPWVLGFAAVSAAVWNHVVVGLLIVVAAAWELWDVRHQTSKATA